MSATPNVYNSTFNLSQAIIETIMGTLTTSACQFSWSAPTNWPFLKDKPGYNENITWLFRTTEYNKRVITGEL